MERSRGELLKKNGPTGGAKCDDLPIMIKTNTPARPARRYGIPRRSFLSAAAGLCAASGLRGSGGLSGYVRVSPRDRRYFELSDGSPFIPIGLNIVQLSGPDPTQAMDTMEGWLASLSANGGNLVRVWISSEFWDVEHETSGKYDGAKAARIDWLLDLCRKYRIRAMLTLEHFRHFTGVADWSRKPLHLTSQGGPASSIADFFDGERSRAQFKRKIAWFAGRYGDRPEVFGWELWNEVDCVAGGDYAAWTEIMLAELHKAFPQNLATQSLGSLDREDKCERYRRFSTMRGNDIAQVHRYLDLGAALEVCHGPMDVLVADAVRELFGFHPERPILLSESGAVQPRHSGPFKYYGKDVDGIILHDVLFAPFFSGSCGTGQIWHWDVYVAKNHLWHHFGRFAEAVRDLDPAAEGLQPAMVPHERLRVYALRGKHTFMAWCRDARNTWQSELENGEKPEILRNLEVDTGLSGAGVARIYDPWTEEWTQAHVTGGRVPLPEFSRSLVISIAV
jgi:hypothetical protein